MQGIPSPAAPREAHLRPGSTGLGRRLLLWIGLGAALFVLQAVISPRLGCLEPTRALLAAGGLFLAIAAAFFARAGVQLRAFTRANAEASAAVYRGELERACALFEQNARRFRSPSLHPISIHNLADTLLQRGELERALELAAAVAGYRGLLMSPLVAASAPSLVASCYALLGDLESARAWLPRAQQAAASIACENALVPEVLLACREGRRHEALRRLEERRRQADSTLAGTDQRILRLMRAFALENLPEQPDEERQIARALARPSFEGEYDFLSVRWPELAGYLRSAGWTAGQG